MRTSSSHTAGVQVSIPSGVFVDWNPQRRRLTFEATSAESPEAASELLLTVSQRVASAVLADENPVPGNHAT